MNPTPSPFPPLVAAIYPAIKRLYRGVASEVWMARQRSVDRLVAVKLLRADCEDPVQIRQLVNEGRLLARAHHPGVVRLYDAGVEEMRPWLSLEYLEGLTLADWMRQTPHPGLTEALYAAGAVLRCLEGVHGLNLVHRDVKPANLIEFAPGLFRIIDFGLAIESGSVEADAIALVAGTPRYMSPEQCEGRHATASSDLYSAAVVIYEILAGSPPFSGPAPGDYVHQHCSIPPTPLRQLRSDVPEELEILISKALSKSPAGRPESATALRAALENIRRSL